jgi:formylglycine-generating enzyme required for sulfatase activity
MVMIPGGSFTMGSPADEPEHQSDEGPQHRVTIEPFAMGKTEVTFAEWDACVNAGGCNGYKPPDQEGRGSRPVINVSWKDAKAYVSWLSQHTGKPYRLPSEAEWEYAARAGTRTRYSFGDTITLENANCSRDMLGATEVGTYPPNPWVLYDMHGNVQEWGEDSWDTWHDSYNGAPTDGTAWMVVKEETNPFSIVSILRGGSWNSAPRLSNDDDAAGGNRKAPYIIANCRAANRHIVPRGARSDKIGFRVARTLD